jgi:hypothetical protein
MDKLPDQSGPTELRRLSPIRARPRLLALLLLAATAAVSVGVARAMTTAESAPEQLWTWPQGLGQQAVDDPSGVVSAVASASDVRGPLRVIATGRSGHGSVALIAGTNASHDVCIGYAQENSQLGLQFQCLAPDDARSVLWIGASGGRTASSTDWTSVVGVVRSDVTRVVLLRADGSTQDLPLNAQRAFTYYADSQESPESALATYGTGGAKLESADLRSVASALNQ